MQTITRIDELRQQLDHFRHEGKTVALVPTMGNLHEGHLTLVRAAAEVADVVVTSIFVNPAQFGVGEDFDRYPRTLANDQALLARTGACDLIFAPEVREIYGSTPSLTTVQVQEITSGLCGASRPGHFTGVATIVTKLFNIVQPDTAVFGQKDYQQLAVIRQMVHDLNMRIRILGIPTCRAEDGLALSSRNQYLSETERKLAPVLYQTLQQTASALRQSQADIATLEQSALQTIRQAGFVPDYFSILNLALGILEEDAKEGVILVAARLGNTRLIDNLTFSR